MRITKRSWAAGKVGMAIVGGLLVCGPVMADGTGIFAVVIATNSFQQTMSGSNYFMGNVGIGTNSPTEKLVIRRTANFYGWMHTDGIRELASWVGTMGCGLGARSTNDLFFFVDANNYHMKLTTNGNLAIGLNKTPTVKLDVDGAGKFSQGISYITNLGDISMGVYTNQP